MSDEPIRAAAEFWDREVHAPTHSSWMEDATVRSYINGCMDGLWPLAWFQKRYPGVRFNRALSIGCGTGPMERDLILRNLCDRIDAFDGSISSISTARALARQEGMERRIRYFVADFNDLNLRDTARYDCVIFHQSLHHVAHLEKLFRLLLSVMDGDAFLYVDEYIGPSRTDWNETRIEPLRALYASLPRSVRLHEELPLPIQADDPSEAIRSGEILEQLAIGFDVDVVRGYGGNVLSVLYPATRLLGGSVPLLASLVQRDREAAGADGPFYALIIAKPKRGLRRLAARARYFLEPKLRRLKWEVMHRIDDSARF